MFHYKFMLFYTEEIIKGLTMMKYDLSMLDLSVVSHQGFNTLATYFRGLTTGSSICNDKNNKELY